MGMNPDTNVLERLQLGAALEKQLEANDKKAMAQDIAQLVRPNGEPVPKHWTVFRVGEHYVINGYTFRCAYFNETTLLFEPVGPVILGETEEGGG